MHFHKKCTDIYIYIYWGQGGREKYFDRRKARKDTSAYTCVCVCAQANVPNRCNKFSIVQIKKKEKKKTKMENTFKIPVNELES